MDIMKSFDRYVIQSRIVPVLIVCFPLAALVSVWLPKESIGWKLVSGLMALVLLTLVAQLGRNPGKAKEAELFRKWGGKPSIQKLRHRSATRLAWVSTERIFARLSAEVGFSCPTKADEEADPVSADEVYEAFVDHMKEATRGDRILHSENISYGFSRNLWAMKAPGIGICLIGILGAVAGGFIASDTETMVQAAAVTLIDTALLTWWLFRINEDWVRVAAEAYADRLVKAYLGLKPEKAVAAA